MSKQMTQSQATAYLNKMTSKTLRRATFMKLLKTGGFTSYDYIDTGFARERMEKKSVPVSQMNEKWINQIEGDMEYGWIIRTDLSKRTVTYIDCYYNGHTFNY